MKLFIVVNEDRFFLSHRKDIAIAAVKEGFDVTIVTKNTGMFNEIKSLGVKTVNLPIEPTGMNPIKEIRTLKFLYSLYRRNCPDIVHHVGLKNILWGGLAARLAGVKGVVDAVSGLGGLFNGGEKTFVSKRILDVIRFNHNRGSVKVIFQNGDDLNIFMRHKAVNSEQITFIKGSGVDLKEYGFCEAPDENPLKVIFTARMVKEKGVTDLIEAAELLKDKYGDRLQFLLCGRLADNKSAITEEYMRQHCDGKYICWLGLRNDVKELLKQSDIMVFPSYYREGLPKSLIEACAIGRPIITCDSVGCRDVVDDGVNGYLVPPRSPEMIAQRISDMIDSPELRFRMGRKSRERAEQEFSIENVVNKHLEIYNSLIK